jgi:hypothetical protein
MLKRINILLKENKTYVKSLVKDIENNKILLEKVLCNQYEDGINDGTVLITEFSEKVQEHLYKIFEREVKSSDKPLTQK